ncbi:phosphoglycerate mutase [Immersiella caudata]|uniref:Phosphoglycerate mutase n=1 Tax=Immersiella caudata TaxID=314043 RepID=A0AA40C595_9PEZI|nr:phosphoglycerate mutase [Immersiella caudata]
MACSYRFSALSGYFVDNVLEASSCLGGKLTTRPNLGLIDRQYDPNQPSGELPWARFRQHVDHLNQQSPPGESYKVLYLVRHGLSVHNIFMEEVGNEAWKKHWSRLEGNGVLTWLDAKLTAEGVMLSQDLGRRWINWSKEQAIPLPETIYTSPLARCLETTRLVYSPALSECGRSLEPVVKEMLRERLTNHTCDKRSLRSWIASHYPKYVLESDFEEEDVLWKADRFETADEHTARKQQLLEDIFSKDNAQFVSLTTHSYAISAILEVVGAPHFRVSEGAVIPLLVKARRLPV